VIYGELGQDAGKKQQGKGEAKRERGDGRESIQSNRVRGGGGGQLDGERSVPVVSPVKSNGLPDGGTVVEKWLFSCRVP